MHVLGALLCKSPVYLRGLTVRNGITHDTIIVDACKQTEVKAGRHYEFLALLLDDIDPASYSLLLCKPPCKQLVCIPRSLNRKAPAELRLPVSQ